MSSRTVLAVFRDNLLKKKEEEEDKDRDDDEEKRKKKRKKEFARTGWAWRELC